MKADWVVKFMVVKSVIVKSVIGKLMVVKLIVVKLMARNGRAMRVEVTRWLGEVANRKPLQPGRVT